MHVMSAPSMEEFKKRSDSIFGALDAIKPPRLPEKSEADTHSSSSDFRRPQGVYTPPAKRQKTNPTESSSSHHDTGSPPQYDSKRVHRDSTTRHNDRYRHSKPRHHVRSHDQGRRSHRQPQDPAKWTKYDLKNDGTEHLAGLSGEQANRKIAYQFLHQLKESNQPEEEDVQDAKIVFKRPKHSRDHSEGESSKECQDGVRMMPEYVVGVSGGKKRQQSKTGSGRGSNSEGTVRTKTSVTLSHLEEHYDN